MAYKVALEEEAKGKAVKPKPKKLYRMESCKFKRRSDSISERGVLLNEGDLGILDGYGNVVQEVWGWWRYRSFQYDVGRFFEGEDHE